MALKKVHVNSKKKKIYIYRAPPVISIWEYLDKKTELNYSLKTLIKNKFFIKKTNQHIWGSFYLYTIFQLFYDSDFYLVKWNCTPK